MTTPDAILALQVASLEQQLRDLGVEPQGLKQRDGDQRLPIANDKPRAHELVMADIADRMAVGIQRYGSALQAFNGRDTLQDIYDELLDGAVYMRAVLEMRKAADSEVRAVLVQELGSDIADRVANLLSDRFAVTPGAANAARAA